MTIEKKVTNQQCAKLCGVGRPTVVDVRKMLGISGAHKLYASEVASFLRKYQDFSRADAVDLAAMIKFQQRHPDFVLPK